MIYFGYPLDIHRWKTKPDRFRAPNPKTVDEKLPPKPKPLDPKPTDIRTKTDPLPSLGHGARHIKGTTTVCCKLSSEAEARARH